MHAQDVCAVCVGVYIEVLKPLTSEILGETQQEADCLVVAVAGTAGGAEHQGFCSWSSRRSQDPIHISASNHLREREREILFHLCKTLY